MSTAAPANSYLARTLEPQEREGLEALRRQTIQQLWVVVAAFLLVVLLSLPVIRPGWQARRENLLVLLLVVPLVVVVWMLRRRAGQMLRDLDQAAVYRLEGTLERKRKIRKKSRVDYKLKVSGEQFDVDENQFTAVQEGTACTVEFLPASRLALSVNDVRRWL